MPWQEPHWRSGRAHWMQWSVMIAGASQRGQSEGAVSAIGGSFTRSSGVPAKSQISWGGLAPGRRGRADARSFGGVTL